MTVASKSSSETMSATSNHGSTSFHNCLVFVTAYMALVLDVGLLLSLSMLLVDIMNTFNTTRAEAVTVQSAAIGVYCGLGFLNGAIVSRFGTRRAGMFGAGLAVFGLALSFAATSVAMLYFSISLCMAIGVSLLYIGSCTVVGQYFPSKSGVLLLSVHATGSSIGGIAYPYLLSYLSNHFGLKGTFLIVSGIVLNSFAFAILWKPRENDKDKPNNTDKTNQTDESNAQGIEDKHEESNAFIYPSKVDMDQTPNAAPSNCIKKEFEKGNVLQRNISTAYSQVKILLKTSGFISFAIAQTIAICAILSFLLVLVDVFIDKGLEESHAYLGLMVFNITGTVGRLLPGILMQIPCVATLSVPMLGCAIGIIGLVCMLFVQTYVLLVLISGVIGLSFGILVAVFSVTSVSLVGPDNLPMAIGMIFTTVGILEGVIGPVTGYIRDITGTYTISLSVAAGSMAVALAILMQAQWMEMKHRPKDKPNNSRNELDAQDENCMI